MLGKRIKELKNRLDELTAIMDTNDYDPVTLEKEFNELLMNFSKLDEKFKKLIEKEESQK
jgi:chromosome segregation ATPase